MIKSKPTLMLQIAVSVITFVVLLVAVESFFRFNQRYQLLAPWGDFYVEQEWVERFDMIEDDPQFEYIKKLTQPTPRKYPKDVLLDTDRRPLEKYIKRFIDPAIENALGLFKPGAYSKLLIYAPTDYVYYKSHFTIDSFGRRISSAQPTLSSEKFVLMFGCSYLFGDGLEDKDTIPFLFQNTLSKTRVYNISHHGYGPNDHLYHLEKNNKEYLAGISEKKGISIYLYIDAHMHRALGSATWFRLDENHTGHPYFSGDPLEYKGSFLSGRYWTTQLYLAFARTAVQDFFKLELPIVNDYEVQLFVRMISKIRDYTMGRGSEKFYFVFYPQEKQFRDRLIPALEAAHIDYIDYSMLDLARILKNNDRISEDGHPTALANKLVVDLLKQDLRQ